MDRLLNISKVEPSGFSSTKLLAELIRDTEELYTTHFGEHGLSHPHFTTDAEGGVSASGNKKKALSRLRAGWTQKTHYCATFRSGVYLGLAIPALASGLYQSAPSALRD